MSLSLSKNLVTFLCQHRSDKAIVYLRPYTFVLNSEQMSIYSHCREHLKATQIIGNWIIRMSCQVSYCLMLSILTQFLRSAHTDTPSAFKLHKCRKGQSLHFYFDHFDFYSFISFIAFHYLLFLFFLLLFYSSFIILCTHTNVKKVWVQFSSNSTFVDHYFSPISLVFFRFLPLKLWAEINLTTHLNGGGVCFVP